MKLGTMRETANIPVQEIIQVQVKDKPLFTDNQSVSKGFQFLSRSVNPEYDSGLIRVPLRVYQLHHNVPVKERWIKTKPKHKTTLLQTNFDRDTGEVLGQSVYETDDLKSGNNRKIKAVNRFCDHFSPLYGSYKVSLLLMTFTIANQAKTDIRNLLHGLKKRCKRNGLKVHGYLWISEVSPPSEKSSGYHWHYHVILATDRIRCKGKGMPKFLFLDDLWGALCRVDFVENSVRHYLSSYFKKNNWRINDQRSYGCVGVPKKK